MGGGVYVHIVWRRGWLVVEAIVAGQHRITSPNSTAPCLSGSDGRGFVQREGQKVGKSCSYGKPAKKEGGIKMDTDR